MADSAPMAYRGIAAELEERHLRGYKVRSTTTQPLQR